MKRQTFVLDGETIRTTWGDEWSGFLIRHRPTRSVQRWWWYSVRRFPKPPPFNLDPIARHFGFVEGVSACSGPICEEHEWKVPS